MCSLSVYSAFIRHPVPQAAFWKAVFIGAFLFMLRGGRSALTALCWIRSICLHSKTLCRRTCVCVCERGRERDCVRWVGLIYSDASVAGWVGQDCKFRKYPTSFCPRKHRHSLLHSCLFGYSISQIYLPPKRLVAECLCLSLRSASVLKSYTVHRHNKTQIRHPEKVGWLKQNDEHQRMSL